MKKTCPSKGLIDSRKIKTYIEKIDSEYLVAFEINGYTFWLLGTVGKKRFHAQALQERLNEAVSSVATEL